jgi:predicted DNA-binding transcriptional regulator YafY
VTAAEQAQRDLRDSLAALLTSRQVEPVPARAAYALPFPVLSATDAVALAVTLEEGTARAWAWVLDQATERSTRQLAVATLAAAEVRAVGWRAAAGRTPVTTPFPGLPDS